MLVIQMFLPRFLVLEGLLFFHLVHQGQACNRKQQQRTGDADRSSSVDPSPGATKEEEESCTVDLDQFKTKFLPLFLSSEAGEMILPGVPNSMTCQKLLTLPRGSALATCPGAKVTASGRESSRVSCVRGSPSNFEVEGRTVPLGDLACSKSIRESVEISPSSSSIGRSCGPAGGEGKWVEIGWKSEAGSPLVPQISVCFDGKEGRTHFANHTIHGYAYDCRMSDSKRPSFKEDQFLQGFAAEQAYKSRNQKGTLESLLGPKAAEKIYSAKSGLTRGHLVPDGDFIFQELQDATYHFINVAPQWQSFNNGNWRAIETAVRSYASASRAALQVYTGTLGILEYEDDGNKLVRMFLAKDPVRKTYSAIPVPEFFWKIVYNPALDQAIVFVGLNNPHATGDVSTNSVVCPDICASAKWFFFHQGDVSKGFSYCCSYQDFKGVIDWVPDLGDPDILENILIPKA